MTPSAHHARVHKDPSFGWDPWLNKDTTPQHIAGTALYAGADTIGGDIGLLPSGLDMYASYVDNYGGWNELVARFGGTGAMLISVTIFNEVAHCGDFEPGAMVIPDFPDWYDHRALKTPGLPWGYTSASSMPALINEAQGRPFIRWSAHYGFGPHICAPSTCGWPQAHWTQWDDHGASGQNLDRSLGTYLPVKPPPPLPPLPPGVDPMSVAITAKPDGTVVAVCESTVAAGKGCGTVFALWSTAPAGPDGQPVWHGAAGKTGHLWVSLGVPGS